MKHSLSIVAMLLAIAAAIGKTPHSMASELTSLQAESGSSDALRARSIEAISYLWVPGMKGTISRSGRSAEVSESVGDTLRNVIDNFKLAFSGRLEFRADPFVLFADVMYVALEDPDVNSPAAGPGDVEFSEAIVETGIAWTAIDKSVDGSRSHRLRVEPLLGIRGYYLSLNLDFPLAGVDVSGERFWADGLAGVRTSLDVTDDLSLFARADVGTGGSDLAWNVIVGARLRLGDHGAVYGGYRVLDIDYDDGGQRFEFDIRMAGPFVGVGFTF
ncbi:MAG: porin family protein [Phycisphaerae bacterium]|nr:porin family protein [Phycisphaerae bacterium]